MAKSSRQGLHDPRRGPSFQERNETPPGHEQLPHSRCFSGEVPEGGRAEPRESWHRERAPRAGGRPNLPAAPPEQGRFCWFRSRTEREEPGEGGT